MKYVWPRTTVGESTEPRCGFETSVVVPQPVVSSLHAISPPAQLPVRRYATVSNVVCAVLHVWIVAVPERGAVHA